MTTNIETPSRSGVVLELPVAASTHIHAGTLVAANASGQIVPATDTAGLRVIGRADAEVDNSDGAAGDKSVPISRGVFRIKNSEGSPVAAGSIGDDAFVEDPETVRGDPSATTLVAGKVLGLDADGEYVWIDTVPALYEAASTSS